MSGSIFGNISTHCPVIREHPLNQGRIAWWLPIPGRMGGSTLFDLMGQYPAAAFNGPIWDAKGLRYTSASSQYMQAPAPGLGTLNEFTFAARFTMPSLAGHYSSLVNRFASFDGGDVNRLRLGLSPAGYYCDGKSCFALVTDAPPGLAAGVECLAVFTVSAAPGTGWAVPTIYHNGVALATTFLISSGVANNTAGMPFWLGTDKDQNYADLWIGEASIWSRALSAPEVAQLWAESRNGYPNLLRRSKGFIPAFGPSGFRPAWLKSTAVLGSGIY
ncbi:MAG: LamG-like jellyroll fold domain-containing protein [Isosphaeraceae bacterium]